MIRALRALFIRPVEVVTPATPEPSLWDRYEAIQAESEAVLALCDARIAARRAVR